MANPTLITLAMLLSNERTELGIHLERFLGKLQRILSQPPGIALTDTEHELVSEMLPIIEGTAEHLQHETDYFTQSARDTEPPSGVSLPRPAEPTVCTDCSGTGLYMSKVCPGCFGVGELNNPVHP